MSERYAVCIVYKWDALLENVGDGPSDGFMLVFNSLDEAAEWIADSPYPDAELCRLGPAEREMEPWQN